MLLVDRTLMNIKHNTFNKCADLQDKIEYIEKKNQFDELPASLFYAPVFNGVVKLLHLVLRITSNQNKSLLSSF